MLDVLSSFYDYVKDIFSGSEEQLGRSSLQKKRRHEPLFYCVDDNDEDDDICILDDPPRKRTKVDRAGNFLKQKPQRDRRVLSNSEYFQNRTGYALNALNPTPTMFGGSRKSSLREDDGEIDYIGTFASPQKDKLSRNPLRNKSLLDPQFRFSSTSSQMPTDAIFDNSQKPRFGNKSYLKSKTKSVLNKTSRSIARTRDDCTGFMKRLSAIYPPNTKAKSSYRLDQKLQYQMLINKYLDGSSTNTECMEQANSMGFCTKLSDRALSGGALTITKENRKWAEKHVGTLEKVRNDDAKESLSSSKFDFGSPVASSFGNGLVTSTPVATFDLTNGASSSKVSDDLAIIKEIKSPLMKRSISKNNLETQLVKSAIYDGDWLTKKQEHYNALEMTSNNLALEAEETKRGMERARNKVTESMIGRIEQRIKLLEIKYPEKVIDIPKVEPLPPLTPEMENMINQALRRGPPNQIVADKFNLQITRRDIHTFTGLNWLNDEVINFFMNLLVERGENDNMPSVYAFNTFFYPKLIKSGYSTIKRWTKKVDVFSHDVLLVPIHLGMHWCMAIIDLRKKTIKYFDSMLGNNDKCLTELEAYLESEHLDKKKTTFDGSGWTKQNIKKIPQQMNGSDCGMFACRFAEVISRDAEINFSQEDMPYFRKRMIYETITMRLL